MKYAWIDGERKAYPLPAMYTTLAVSVSGCRAWKRGGKAQGKRLRGPQLLALIRVIHAELKGAYGSPRMLRELCGRGFSASKDYAAYCTSWLASVDSCLDAACLPRILP